MPSSKSRRRIEVPTAFYDRLKQIADIEERTVTSVHFELLQLGLANYQPTWMPRRFLNRFNEPARRALTLANEEAQNLNHHFVGTEHLLLGLLREPEGIAAQVLRRLWIEIDTVRAGVSHIIGQHSGTAKAAGPTGSDEDIGYTPRARKVLALAVDEAQRLGHDHVGTEHLLLALAREGEGIAAGLLQTFGALGRVREFTIEAIRQRDAEGTAEMPPGQ